MNKTLLEYIKNVVDLEKSIYIQKQAISRLAAETKYLGIEKKFQSPSMGNEYSVDGHLIFPLALCGGGVGIGAGIVLGGIGGKLFLFAILGAIIGVVIEIVTTTSKNREMEEQYNSEYAVYKAKVDKDKERVKKEQAQIKQIRQVIGIMYDKCSETEELLRKYYSLDIIYPKYRNLVAMCSIYDYLLSGMCTELGGRDGAYAKFDLDENFHRIHTRLDVVIDKLDEIKNTQYMLYEAIQEGNRVSRQLLDASVQQVRLAEQTVENTQLGAYYQEQAAIEARQIKALSFYDTLRS